MFHFAGYRASRRGSILWDTGLPHSDTPGSKTACVSPGLFAACRVLLRLPPPRHPPRARRVWTPKSASDHVRLALPGKRSAGISPCLAPPRKNGGAFGSVVIGSLSFLACTRKIGVGWMHAAGCQRVSPGSCVPDRKMSCGSGEERERLVGAHGLGPWTSSLSETRSNQLSYAPGSLYLLFPPSRLWEADSAMRCALPGSLPQSRDCGGACSLKRR